MEEPRMLLSVGPSLWARPSPSLLHSRMSTRATFMEREVHYLVLNANWFDQM